MPEKSLHTPGYVTDTAVLASRILIMDDEEYIRETFGELLKRMGCDIVYAHEGNELLETLKTARSEGHRFNAVIMDLTIPGGMGGKETISELRKVDKEIKAFVASGYADDPIMANPEEYGFTDRIAKPFRNSELKTLMEKWMLI